MTIRHLISLIVTSICLSANANTDADSLIYTIDNEVDEMLVHVRTQGKQWSLIWDYIDEYNYRQATIKLLSTSGGDEFFNYSSRVTISNIKDGIEEVSKATDVHHANKSASIKLSVKDNTVRIYAGDGTRCIAENSLMHYDGKIGSKVIFRQIKPTHKPAITKEIRCRIPKTFAKFKDIDELNSYLEASTDSIEGYWQYLDRNVNTPSIQNGGYYELATVRSESGYDIIYISGADKYSYLWAPLQIKGRLIGTIFQNNFDLEWIDSKRSEIMQYDIYASFEQNSIMTVHFPLLNSEIRFSRKRR